MTTHDQETVTPEMAQVIALLTGKTAEEAAAMPLDQVPAVLGAPVPGVHEWARRTAGASTAQQGDEDDEELREVRDAVFAEHLAELDEGGISIDHR